MESNSTLSSSTSLRLKRKIPISYNGQTPSNVIFLKNDICLVQFPTGYLKIDLSSNQQKIQTIDITKFKTDWGRNFPGTWDPIPHPNGQFVIGVSDTYLISKNQCKRIQKKWDGLCPDMEWQRLIYFHSSGLLVNTYSTGGDRATSLEIFVNTQQHQNIQKQKFLETIPARQYFSSPLDSDSLFVSNFNKNSITIMDFLDNSKKNWEIKIPFQYTYRTSIYLLNNYIGIVGFLSSESSIFELFRFEAKQNEKMEKIAHFENVKSGKFVLLNKPRSTIVIELRMNDSSKQLILFNYELNKVVWRHRHQNQIFKEYDSEDYRFHQQSLRFNKDLSKYIALESQGNKHQLVEYIECDIKKIYFHLFKKSCLEKKFGERLGRELIKVLL